MILDRFKELVNDYYTELTNEEIRDSLVQTQKAPSFQRKKKNTQIQK